MSAEQNKAIVRRFIVELGPNSNPTLVDELLAPNYVNHMMPGGREGFKKFEKMLATSFPNLKFHSDVEYLVAEEDHVFSRIKFHVTNGTKEATVSDTAEFRLSNGKIIEDWPPCGTAAMLQQVGVVLPSAPAAMV
jgi:predicted SnoaL-like aldol condensation-catalyzing enzyme